MAWPWPSHPAAYVFSENALGIYQGGLLQNVYHLHYGPANRSAMESEALVQAYAKPLLLALLLFVVTAKLKRLVEIGRPGLSAADRDKLHEGLAHARNPAADGLTPRAAHVGDRIAQSGPPTSMLRGGRLPATATRNYK